ncbi:cyclopropane-fatty-acyl-phospholipid synthase family protein [Blastopirellula sp. JC732]|uniref:Cyclopropane-fatty-acyl-phospholipid synthase family protein n=1 Tax=Blastopirellula sediminis TaxID=2894196 RepID=A0A9X1SJF2_9BACT|nr:cyclopropane-fatty-acyl-phospholipid synthase family protein [Blastopirellula sediminis]MCC9608364.1 cyclopropane-fatty-acyl-phospholipid synthase family protein [Blastopirellula sediminis]MCC9628859.1 cyclopropane-fatty-acyl-phospholipid synthase family protein [Blastopirellula sediminis]
MSSSTLLSPETSARPLALETPETAAPRRSWLQEMSRRKLLRWLDEVAGGEIRYSDASETKEFGRRSPDQLRSDWIVSDDRFFSRLATGGSVGIAEAYLQGEWRSDDLTALLQILCRNMDRTTVADSGFATLAGWGRRLLHYFDRNTRDGSRRNIAAHYDLSNDFFSLFLDATWMYSSAYFESDEMSLEEASIAKLQRICDKLELKPNDSLLEIGTGWGGFALHAAQQGVRDITTTTISQMQREKAQERFQRAGVADRIHLLNADYRDLTGQYDKIVSIEMVEAVGEKFLDDYFRQCARLLKPGGRLVLQAIVMPEQRYDSYRRSVDFIQAYIFPGGFLPSVAAMQASIGRTSNLRLQGLEDISSHYATTLWHWRQRFFDSLEEVKQLGFDERFIRMWEYYLCYCEAAFREKAVRVVQIAWDKPNY